MNDKNLVDLATLDTELESIIIEEYPGKFFGDQHMVDTSDPDCKVYRFFRLDKEKLLPFLERYKAFFEYEVLDSNTGEPVAVNKVNPVHSMLLGIMQRYSTGN